MDNSAMNTLTLARSYHSAGLCVIPIRADGTKAPAIDTWKCFQKELPLVDQIDDWFSGAPRGIALLGGVVSGNLECLDFDTQAESIFPAWSELVEAERPELLARLSVCRTPKPGYHVRYRCRDPVPGNLKLAQDPTQPDAKQRTLIETRGEGGYALAPGCPPECHELNRTYDHIAGPPLHEIATIGADERDVLIRCARSFDRSPPADPHETNGRYKTGTGLSPGDDFCIRGPDWAALLEPHGWSCVRQQGQVRYWRRPGKDGPGWSATTGVCTSKNDRELLAVFSSNAAPFPGPEGNRVCSTHSKFAAFALLNHDSDFTAAARTLAAQGYGEKRPNPRQENWLDRPRILAQHIDLALVTPQAWDAMRVMNEPPSLFRYGSVPARIETDDDGQPIVRVMTVDRMRHRLARDVSWYKLVKDEEVDCPPPLEVVRDVLACPDAPLPVLTRIVQAPIFAADGILQTEPGYSPSSKTYFAPTDDFTVPHVSQSPSQAEIKEAVTLLTIELIGDFPFVGESEKAHTLAALLGAFARELIHGPIPLHSFEAPSPGTGKTLLIEAITLPALGKPANAMSEARDEDEWRKRLFAKLFTAPSVVFIDNVKRRVDSGALSSVLTAYPQWEDRLLGKSEIIAVPVRCIWLMSSNNPGFSSEMARRTIRIRLDAKVDQPWLRTGFRHPKLLEWANRHRGRLVWAALTLIQAWLASGRPPGQQTLGMYESWSQTMGGILDNAGVPGFLANLQEFYETADAEGATWRAFVAAWWAARGDEEVKAAELFTLAIEAGMSLGEKSEQSQKVRLGQKVAESRDRVFAIDVGEFEKVNLRIGKAGIQSRATKWRLVKSEYGESQ